MNSETTQQSYYQLSPLVPLQFGWQILLLIFAFVVLGGFAYTMIRKDTRQQSKALLASLLTLRFLVLIGLLLFVFNLQLRTATQVTRKSRLAVLVDTSLSMGLRDPSAIRSEGLTNNKYERRIDEVIESFESNVTLATLAQQHELTIYTFGENDRPSPIAELGRQPTRLNLKTKTPPANAKSDTRILLIGVIFTLCGALLILRAILFARRNPDAISNAHAFLLGGMLALMSGLVTIAVGDLSAPENPWFSSTIPTADAQSEELQRLEEPPSSEKPSSRELDNWQVSLNPNGTSTKLGSAILSVIEQERGGPIAGVVVISDGQNTGGIAPTRAIAAAANASIPVYSVGIGSTQPPRNIQITDLQLPPRVFPNDNFRIKGLIQSFGLSEQSVKVRLRSMDHREREVPVDEAEATIKLKTDGQPTPVEFEISRAELGKRRYLLEVERVERELDINDNIRSGTVEVIDRKSVVLMIAGGPSREFRFLRNQLFRDEDVELHVWLQSAKAGADQESDILLTEFPQTRDGIFQYDCMIAFDPDWRELDSSQAELLERWVAEKAGGVLMIAGPVNTPEWTRKSRGDPTIDKIRRLYPVSFFNAGSAVLKTGRFAGRSPFPLQFTREGRAAQYLWIGENATQSANTWSKFEGVFGYYGVNEAKPGAETLAYFSDDSTSIDGRLPIYLASQFYGAGRVFFQASSEMWRVRKLDVEYFEQYYLKLIRWLSQGRLLRNSTRGVLISDRERCWMGDSVSLQAILKDAQDQPFLAEKVTALITDPMGRQTEIQLNSLQEAVRPGTFSTTFTTSLQGEYRINLPIPNSPQMEVLSTTIQVNIPNLEKERPIRNTKLLNELADKTQGYYFQNMKAWDAPEEDPLSPLQLIAKRDQVTTLPGTPNQMFRFKLMAWLLIVCVTSLCLEWTFRRINKLA